nr:hypothetical protein [Delftia acidovorans]
MTFVPDRYAYPTVSAGPTTPLPAMVRQHFTVAHEAVNAQAIAWSDYVGRILDAPVSRSQVEHGFRGDLDACVLPDMIYLDSRTDRLIQARTGARISRDSMRDFVFHVAVHGMLETHVKQGPHTRSTQFVPGILALDMAQPMRMVRPTGTRTLAFFLPRAMVESEIADAQSIHGRVIAFSSLSASPIPDLLFALCHQLSSMPAEEAATSIRTCAHLILGAFGKQHDLSLRAGMPHARRFKSRCATMSRPICTTRASRPRASWSASPSLARRSTGCSKKKGVWSPTFGTVGYGPRQSTWCDSLMWPLSRWVTASVLAVPPTSPGHSGGPLALHRKSTARTSSAWSKTVFQALSEWGASHRA